MANGFRGNFVPPSALGGDSGGFLGGFSNFLGNLGRRFSGGGVDLTDPESLRRARLRGNIGALGQALVALDQGQPLAAGQFLQSTRDRNLQLSQSARQEERAQTETKLKRRRIEILEKAEKRKATDAPLNRAIRERANKLQEDRVELERSRLEQPLTKIGKARQGLIKGNLTEAEFDAIVKKETQITQPRNPTIGAVIAPIMAQLARGEPITEGQFATLDLWQKTAPTDRIVRESLAELAPSGISVRKADGSIVPAEQISLSEPGGFLGQGQDIGPAAEDDQEGQVITSPNGSVAIVTNGRLMLLRRGTGGQ